MIRIVKNLSTEHYRVRKVILVWCSIALMLISSIGAWFIQTDAGKVEVMDLSIETDTGIVSMLMYRPDDYKYLTDITDKDGNVSQQTVYRTFPCVICVHGNLNSREMQDYAYTELARRGFVVISLDMFGHGHSSAENPGADIQSVLDYVQTLSYVDQSKIGMTGHSLGAVQIQRIAAANPDVVSALLPVGWSIIPSLVPALPDTSIGSIVGKYDEFFYYISMTDENGTLNTDENGNNLYNSVEEYNQLTLGSVLDASDIENTDIQFGKYYSTNNGKVRIVWQENINHPALVYNTISTRHVIDFFETAWNLDFESSTGISDNNIIWPWKVFFNVLGLIGFFAFILCFASYLLELPLFASLKKDDTASVTLTSTYDHKKKLIYWCNTILLIVLSGALFFPLMHGAPFFDFEGANSYNKYYPYQYANYSMIWAFFMGLICLGIFIIFTFLQKSKERPDSSALSSTVQQVGLNIGAKNILKSVFLALTTVFVGYVFVFLFDYLFKTDFRIYTLAVKTFSPTMLKYVLPYFIFYFVYYFVNALTINASVRYDFPEWLNVLIICLTNTLGLIFVLAAYYIPFFINGTPVFYESINPILLYPFIPLLCITGFYSRYLYRKTGSIYIPAVINTLLVTIITLSCTRIFI